MKTRFVLFACLLGIAGCGESHTTVPGTDAGPVADAPPSADVGLRACSLGPTAMPPPAVGDACFCDGPFVVSGDLVYRHGFDLEVIDVSAPRSPTLVRHVARRDGFAEGIAVAGRSLVVAGTVLEVFDLTDPRTPASASSIDFGTGGMASDVVADGDFVWVGSTDESRVGAIEAMEASDPSSLVRHGRLELGARFTVRALAVGEGALFALVDEELDASPFLTATLVSITLDPDAPIRLDTVPLPRSASLGQLATENGLVAVSLLGEGTTLFDGHDPSNLERLVEIEGSTGATAFFGDLAVLPNETGAFTLYDVTSPSAPRSLASLTIGTDTAHAAFLGDAILVSGGWGMAAVPYDCD